MTAVVRVMKRVCPEDVRSLLREATGLIVLGPAATEADWIAYQLHKIGLLDGVVADLGPRIYDAEAVQIAALAREEADVLRRALPAVRGEF